MKIVFVSYNNQPGYSSPEAWIEKMRTFADLMEALAKTSEVAYVKQINYAGHFVQNDVAYIFLKSSKKNNRFPLALNRSIRKLKPDVVIVSGLRYPVQIMQLRRKLGKSVLMIGRHHADKAPTGLRSVFQQMSDRCFNAYLFTSRGNAAEWIESGIIRDTKKIFELVEASTSFSRRDKEQSMQITGMAWCYNFLWVGRLNENKDPLTVLNGFEQYLAIQPEAKLYMIFQTEDMLPEVQRRTDSSDVLGKAVILKGFIPYNELPFWYSAADYFISGSHREGGSYALLEAMACGCIPIVTDIPAAVKMVEAGKYGIIYRCGDANDLMQKLSGISLTDQETFSRSITDYFNRELSATAIAAKLSGYCEKLISK